MAPRANPRATKTISVAQPKSRVQAEAATDRAVEQQKTVESDSWPRGSNGQPMMRVTMTAAELIPTGQFANVSIGPAQVTTFIDQARVLQEQESFFSDDERATLVQALNELAEIVEGEVVAVQRDLVLSSMQQQLAPNGGASS